MFMQEEIDRLIPEIERMRITVTPRGEDDPDFYRELYTILKEMPWSVWERAGFNRVSDVRIYPDLTNLSKEMFPVNLHVRIYYDHINRQDLSGFDRIDSRWADIAAYWEPYREFLVKNLRLSLQRIERLGSVADDEAEVDSKMTDSEIQAELETIPLVNADYDETKLRYYIEGLGLYPLIIKECKREKANRIRDFRRIMVDVSVAAISLMIEQEDNDHPLVMELRDYCNCAKARSADPLRPILVNYLLKSTRSIRELREMADTVISKVREDISNTPEMLYLFDKLGTAEVIRRDTLRLENNTRGYLRAFFIGYIYQERLLLKIEIAFRAIIYNDQEIDSRKLVKDVIFPFGNIDDELWNFLKEGAEIYRVHESKMFSEYDVSVEMQPDGDQYVAKIPLFGEQEKGRTEQEARNRLSKEFEKNHLKWVTRFAVGVEDLIRNKKK